MKVLLYVLKWIEAMRLSDCTPVNEIGKGFNIKVMVAKG